MKKSCLSNTIAASVMALSFVTPSHAIVASIDEFTVFRNSGAVFTDTFSDGIAPPSASYTSVLGAFPAGAESGGSLSLNTAWGGATANALGEPRQALTVTKGGLGLTESVSFDIVGIFNLVLQPPGTLGGSYGVRARETVNNAGAGAPRIATTEVVYNASSGDYTIRFALQDFLLDTLTVLNEIALNANGADQIALGITHGANSTEFYGQYSFISNGTWGSISQFSNFATMFQNGATFEAAQFYAVSKVPEPATMLLLGLGLAGLMVSRRRSQD